MLYRSTRGRAPAVSFQDALLAGLAPDGGLYMPDAWPALRLGPDAGFADVAAAVTAAFTGPEADLPALTAMARAAYAGFDDPAVAPLRRLGDDHWLLELFHGPTLAFKDVAMQLLARLFDAALASGGSRVAIIGATSGDTGAAAIDAFRTAEQADIYILHPKGRVSEVQRRIMTSVREDNVVNIAVDGSFDDCQAVVKALFADRPFAEEMRLGGVNSINWARLAIQITYYATSLRALAPVAPRVSFSVPTGNFGDVFAGYAAKRMGLGVDRLCVAVNDNDILHRVLTSGRYAPATVSATTSPSMDIQVASNFERLVFEASGRDAGGTVDFVRAVDDPGGARLDDPRLAAMRADFVSERARGEEVADMMRRMADEHSILVDPHTAVGLVATEKARADGRLDGPVVTLSTAHAAKFPDAVRAATGRTPDLPDRFADLYDRPERFVEAAASPAAIQDVMRRHRAERRA
ncbi:MAG: threonine synthase [Pseudomonadota bacterium]